MMVEIDHIFICSEVGAPEADHLVALGLVEGASKVHPGQGTANRRFCFHNAMLELVWVHDELEARSPTITPARLWERWKYRFTGYSPFGICLRPKDARRALSGRPAALPFAKWEWRPPYLPHGTRIDVAAGTAAGEPLVFATPFGGRPDALPEERRQPIVHPKEILEVTGLRITLPSAEPTSGVMRALHQAGIVSFEMGSDHLAEIEFDHAAQDQSADFRPLMPLRFRW
jgi:Glyoxalase-like domain